MPLKHFYIVKTAGGIEWNRQRGCGDKEKPNDYA